MSDGIWLRFWPYQERLPLHPERTDEWVEPVEQLPGRVPGWVDESN